MPDPSRLLQRMVEVNRHPLHRAALKWVKPIPYQLHAMNLLQNSLETRDDLTSNLREEMLRQVVNLEAGSPTEGTLYLLQHQEDKEPTMLAENQEEASSQIVEVYQALLTTDPNLDNFPPQMKPAVAQFAGSIGGPQELWRGKPPPRQAQNPENPPPRTSPRAASTRQPNPTRT